MTQFYEYVEPRDNVTSIDEKKTNILNDNGAFIFNEEAAMQSKAQMDADVDTKPAAPNNIFHRSPYNEESTSL